MRLFTRKTTTAPPQGADESTFERRRLLVQQRAKLRRAQQLKERSAAVAGELAAQGKVNNYAWRIRQSAINAIARDEGTADAH